MKTKFVIICLVIVYALAILARQGHLLADWTNDAVPTPPPIWATVSDMIQKMRNEVGDFSFVDIGCGEGSMLKLVCPLLSSSSACEGVEIDADVCAKARNNDSSLTIHNADALTFAYKVTPTVFYLYEPFFAILPKKAMDMYRRLLSRFRELARSTTVHIIYVTGLRRQDMVRLFSEFEVEVIEHKTIWTGFLTARRHAYLLKVNHGAEVR